MNINSHKYMLICPSLPCFCALYLIEKNSGYSLSFCVSYISDSPLGFIIRLQNETFSLVMHECRILSSGCFTFESAI